MKKERLLMSKINLMALRHSYQCLGCWQEELNISQSSYENLLEVFLHSGAITQRHAYEKIIQATPIG